MQLIIIQSQLKDNRYFTNENYINLIIIYTNANLPKKWLWYNMKNKDFIFL